MKKEIFLVAALVSCLACGRSSGTSNDVSGGPSSPGTSTSSMDHPPRSAVVNGNTIEPDMTDEKILAAFGMDPTKATSRKTQGKDGYSMNYEIGDQSVNITRSVVTGVNVMAFGPIKGDWQLGKPSK